MPSSAARTTVAALLVFAAGAPLAASTASHQLCARGAEHIYNLDRDLAIEAYRQAIAADPQDAAAYRGLASALWLSITFRRGNMTVDDYLGKITKPSGSPLPPAPEVAAEFHSSVEKAIALARQRIAANDHDVDAHYELGAAVGLQASYVATVDRSVLGAFRAARQAYDEHERVLALDPSRKDAGLIVGTYRYVVAALSLPLRWVAYVAGFGGGKERGLEMIEAAAAYPGDNQADARIALVLLYNREHRYDDALGELAALRDRYPRNRLMWLESGSTCLRAGRAADAERFLDDGMTRFGGDERPRMFGEQALWHYKRGAARAALGRAADARTDLDAALAEMVQGRDLLGQHLELARLALKSGHDTAAAREHLQAAVRLCDRDNDARSADQARALLK